MDSIASSSLRRSRARGHSHLQLKVGGIMSEVRSHLAQKQAARILEVGCGYGTVLVELRREFGEKVELHGLNLTPDHGNQDLFKRNAINLEIWSVDAIEQVTMPEIRYADISNGLPYESGFFDVIFSQVSWHDLSDKVYALREVNRVLAPGGIAKIDCRPVFDELPAAYRDQVEIWEGDRKLEFWSRLARASGVRQRNIGKHAYLELTKSQDFAYDLGLVLLIRLGQISSDWIGIKSVYRTYPVDLSADAAELRINIKWQPESGHAGSADLPYWPNISSFQLYEDERPLGPRTDSYDEVRRLGGGRFSIGHSARGVELLFSPSDNRDPKSTCRHYTLRGRALQ